MTSRLIGIEGQFVGQSFAVSGPLTIGRAAGNVITVASDNNISRQHARVVTDGAETVIEDLGSQNGTFVNGTRIQRPFVLANGDEVRIGQQAFRFEAVTAPPRRVEVSSGEPPRQPQRRANYEVAPISSSGGLGSDNIGCSGINIDLSGCLRMLIIALIILTVLTIVGLIFFAISFGCGGAAKMVGGGNGSAGQSTPDQGGSGGDSVGSSGGGEQNQQQTPIEIVSVKVAYVKRPGFTGPVPVVLVTWRNVGDKPVSEVRANVNGYDLHKATLGNMTDALIYRGSAIGPNQTHEDTREVGGVVFSPLAGKPNVSLWSADVVPTSGR